MGGFGIRGQAEPACYEATKGHDLGSKSDPRRSFGLLGPQDRRTLVGVARTPAAPRLDGDQELLNVVSGNAKYLADGAHRVVGRPATAVLNVGKRLWGDASFRRELADAHELIGSPLPQGLRQGHPPSVDVCKDRRSNALSYAKIQAEEIAFMR